MSAADVEPGTAAVIFQIKQQTSGYHVGWVQAVKDIKDPKTKEVEDGLYLSQAISYQIHTRENKKTPAKERRIDNERSQQNFAVAINKINSGCLWGFIPDEVWGCCALRVCVGSVFVPGACLNVVPAMRVQSPRLPNSP